MRGGGEGEQHASLAGAASAAARGAREEDHALGVARDVVEVAARAAPRGGPSPLGSGTAAHMPASSWRRNSSTSRSSSSRTSTSPSAISTSPCPGFMRRNFMRAIMPEAFVRRRAPSRRQRGRARGRRARRRGRRPRPMLAQPVAHRPRRDRLRAARAASSGVEAEREVRREHRGVRAAGAVRGAVGVALAGDLDEPLAVEEDVDRLLAVPAGDDDAARAERVHRARELVGASGAGVAAPASARASGRFGVDDRGARQQPLDERARARRASSRSRAATRRPSPGRARSACRRRARRARARRPRSSRPCRASRS